MQLTQGHIAILQRLFNDINEEDGNNILKSIDNSLKLGAINKDQEKMCHEGLTFLSTSMLSFGQESCGIDSDNAALREACLMSRNRRAVFLKQTLNDSDDMMKLEEQAAGL